jgi:hypothetical protein
LRDFPGDRKTEKMNHRGTEGTEKTGMRGERIEN